MFAVQLPSLESMPVWSRLHEASDFHDGTGACTANSFGCKAYGYARRLRLTLASSSKAAEYRAGFQTFEGVD
jgi:hypothetical protein